MILEGNPIGRAGARAFMFALQTDDGDDAPEINMAKCTFDRTMEESSMFNSLEPSGKHELDLSIPYQRVQCSAAGTSLH